VVTKKETGIAVCLKGKGIGGSTGPYFARRKEKEKVVMESPLLTKELSSVGGEVCNEKIFAGERGGLDLSPYDQKRDWGEGKEPRLYTGYLRANGRRAMGKEKKKKKSSQS